jgi:PAS domain S-box-containing protein
MIGVGTDITEQKQREEQSRLDKERLSLALESGALGFWDWNLETGEVLYGGCWASMLGYKVEEIAPSIQRLEKLIHPDDKAVVDKRFKEHFSGQIPEYEAEFRLRKKDGGWLWVLSRGRVVTRDAQGAPLRAVGIHANVHEQHLIREELRAAAKRKDEFLATLAHELRNPLAPIRTGLEILKRDPASDAAKQAREMMDRQLLHMVHLVDDLLDVSRITRGKLELRRAEVTLESIVQVAVEGSNPAIDAAHHRLTTRLPREKVLIYGDATRLSQVVSNLLLNAAKYTPDRGLIELEAVMQGNVVLIKVSDNGIGIPADMLGSVFEMFGQVNQTLERAQGGLGIGLALVRNIVELHEGRVYAASAGVGKGSTFTVELPARAVREEEVPAATGLQAAEREDAMKRVLIVDDNVDGAMSLKLYLEMLGYPVAVTHTGPDAVAYVSKEMPEVIFLDIGLPGMSGYEVAHRIREMPEGKAPLIAAVTGWGADEDKRKSAEAGCNVHLTKPIDLGAAERLLTQGGEAVAG